jgi:hypothetical protein
MCFHLVDGHCYGFYLLHCISWPFVLMINFLCSFCQNGLATKVDKSRKQMKERKNRSKKIRGVKKVSCYDTFQHAVLLCLRYAITSGY